MTEAVGYIDTYYANICFDTLSPLRLRCHAAAATILRRYATFSWPCLRLLAADISYIAADGAITDALLSLLIRHAVSCLRLRCQ